MSDLVGNPEDKFSHNEAHVTLTSVQVFFIKINYILLTNSIKSVKHLTRSRLLHLFKYELVLAYHLICHFNVVNHRHPILNSGNYPFLRQCISKYHDEVLYFLSSSVVAYLDCVGIYTWHLILQLLQKLSAKMFYLHFDQLNDSLSRG